MDNDTLMLSCGAGYCNDREADAGILTITSCSWGRPGRGHRGWPDA
jgi:hypothetical protein